MRKLQLRESESSRTCTECGKPLQEPDTDRSTCSECSSPVGKVADLDVAIRASGDSPDRIREWPAVRHYLRKIFRGDRAEAELWEQCRDWLQAERKLAPEEYLQMPISELLTVLAESIRGTEVREMGAFKEERMQEFSQTTTKFRSHSEIAYCVNVLFRSEETRIRGRELVAEVQQADDQFRQGESEWQKRRRHYFELEVMADEDLLDDASHYTNSDLRWQKYGRDVRVFEVDDIPRKVRERYWNPLPDYYYNSVDPSRPRETLPAGTIDILAWAPVEFLECNSPKPEVPLPPRNIGREYRLAEIVTAFVAIHDADGRFEPIVPADDPICKHWLFEMWLLGKADRMRNIICAAGLEPLLERLEAELAPTAVNLPKSPENSNQCKADSNSPIVNEELSQIRYDGEYYDVSAEGARMVKLLAEHLGEWVAMAKNNFTKPSEVKKKLPGPIRDLIESQKGKGYRIARR